MKPLFAVDVPAFAADARRARLSVEPCFVVARCDGEIIAASSCALRLETSAGPVYLFPRADVSAELRQSALVSREGARVWSIRMSSGMFQAAAFSAPLGGAARGRLAFDPRVVDVVAAPAGGREACRMM